MQKSFISNRSSKVRQYKNLSHNGPELENHFILRLLEPQAKILREDIRSGQSNIKDRLFIQLDYTQDKDDMRNGIITFDTIMYKARLVDLPTILETWKTIDGKNFYKTADVCQMLMVRDNEDLPEDDDTRKKKRDPDKVDKKYLWPHGYTPPLKNVRKRRFRKTLRKKVSNLETLDLPDIEKEVRRLLRTDNEAFSVKWEVVREEDEMQKTAEGGATESSFYKQDLFGELSSSEDEVGNTINITDDEEDSRLSDSLMNEAANSPSAKVLQAQAVGSPLVTEFSSSMFLNEAESPGGGKHHRQHSPSPHKGTPSKSRKRAPLARGTASSGKITEDSTPHPDIINKLYARLSHLESDMTRLLSQRAAQEAETATIENFALKQKFLAKLSDLENQIKDKETEIRAVRTELTT